MLLALALSSGIGNSWTRCQSQKLHLAADASTIGSSHRQARPSAQLILIQQWPSLITRSHISRPRARPNLEKGGGYNYATLDDARARTSSPLASSNLATRSSFRRRGEDIGSSASARARRRPHRPPAMMSKSHAASILVCAWLWSLASTASDASDKEYCGDGADDGRRTISPFQLPRCQRGFPRRKRRTPLEKSMDHPDIEDDGGGILDALVQPRARDNTTPFWNTDHNNGATIMTTSMKIINQFTIRIFTTLHDGETGSADAELACSSILQPRSPRSRGQRQRPGTSGFREARKSR